jgi:hypothetical protein
MLIAVAIGRVWLAQPAQATAAGKRLLDAERDGRTTLGDAPAQSQLPIAVALFGAAALWQSNRGLASALAFRARPARPGATMMAPAVSCGGWGG